MSPTLEACSKQLCDFSMEQQSLPSTPDGGQFASYTLTSPQVGAVRLLLWRAINLEKQNQRLKQAQRDAQALVDSSISYLDQDG